MNLECSLIKYKLSEVNSHDSRGSLVKYLVLGVTVPGSKTPVRLFLTIVCALFTHGDVLLF